AVAIGFLAQRDLATDRAGVDRLELAAVLAKERRERGDFLVVNPDEAGIAGAALAALGAGELKAVLVPEVVAVRHGDILTKSHEPLTIRANPPTFPVPKSFPRTQTGPMLPVRKTVHRKSKTRCR